MSNLYVFDREALYQISNTLTQLRDKVNTLALGSHWLDIDDRLVLAEAEAELKQIASSLASIRHRRKKIENGENVSSVLTPPPDPWYPGGSRLAGSRGSGLRWPA